MNDTTGTTTTEQVTEWPFRIAATIISVPAREARVALLLVGLLCVAAGAILWELERVREAIISHGG